MIRIRQANERGHADHGWLDTYHSFSFADYVDPRHMGFRSLRVLNEDRVAPGEGFGMHPHRDMEIVTYVLDGALEHKDSLGTGSTIRGGDLQRITAGTGVWHSEFNPSTNEPVHLVQIWLLPERKGLTPGYEEKTFAVKEDGNGLRLVASRQGEDGSLTIHQDVALFLGKLKEPATHSLVEGRHAWVQVLRGNVEVNGQRLEAGDGAAVSEERELTLRPEQFAEVLLFDLA